MDHDTRTLGVDLSTNPKLTALCLLDWSASEGAAHIAEIRHGATDETILSVADGVGHIGIDAPFGWPREWAAAVAAHRPGSRFGAEGPPAALTVRYTDRWIAANVGIRPLPVGANLIGATAIRCARLIALLQRPIDVGGAVVPWSVSEVYPAAALKRWGQSWTLYKGRRWREARVALVAALERAGVPIRLTPADRELLEASDDALDALIASLVARAVTRGLTDDAPPDGAESCRDEGWIRVPLAGSRLSDLLDP